MRQAIPRRLAMRSGCGSGGRRGRRRRGALARRYHRAVLVSARGACRGGARARPAFDRRAWRGSRRAKVLASARVSTSRVAPIGSAAASSSSVEVPRPVNAAWANEPLSARQTRRTRRPRRFEPRRDRRSSPRVRHWVRPSANAFDHPYRRAERAENFRCSSSSGVPRRGSMVHPVEPRRRPQTTFRRGVCRRSISDWPSEATVVAAVRLAPVAAPGTAPSRQQQVPRRDSPESRRGPQIETRRRRGTNRACRKSSIGLPPVSPSRAQVLASPPPQRFGQRVRAGDSTQPMGRKCRRSRRSTRGAHLREWVDRLDRRRRRGDLPPEHERPAEDDERRRLESREPRAAALLLLSVSWPEEAPQGGSRHLARRGRSSVGYPERVNGRCPESSMATPLRHAPIVETTSTTSAADLSAARRTRGE